MIAEKYTKDYLLEFLRFSHINTDLYKGLNDSIEKFLKVYDNIIFENEFKINTIKHQFVYLQHFCKYLEFFTEDNPIRFNQIMNKYYERK